MNAMAQDVAEILIVDDQPANLSVLRGILKAHAYRLRTAPNGELALKIIRHSRPDLILLDVLMPGMDGYEVCRRLKRQTQTRDIPVLFMTSLIELEHKLQGFNVGGADYITKPFAVEEVLARVAAHVEIAQLHQKLKEENDRYRSLVDASNEGILIHNDGKVVDVNRTLEQVSGLSRADVIGRDVVDLFPPESSHIVSERMRQDSEHPYEICGWNAQKQITPYEARSKTIQYRGLTLGVITLQDVSWRKTLNTLTQTAQHLSRENLSLKTSLSSLDRLGHLVGGSLLMQKVYERLISFAGSDETVIIYGETGTGKELAARTIFELSDHHTRNFVPVNCGAIQDSLFEAAFFGYRKGAFTGAARNTPGYFEQAQGGVIFLDEVGELPVHMQIKLLRVLNDNTYTPVGAQTPCTADTRIIAATNQDLESLIENGTIRKDFFYRLHVLPVEMPPLRHHKDDIPLLVTHFLARSSSDASPIPAAFMERFMQYDWPGNVRELFNELRRWVNMGHVELGNAFPPPAEIDGSFRFPSTDLAYDEAMDTLEQEFLTRVLRKFNGNRSHAAKALGIGRRTLQRKLAKYFPEAP